MADRLTHFLDIFRNTWQAGTDARLIVECHAGHAWITLHQPLGLPPFPPKQHHRKLGPARLCRNARRAQAREAASASAETAASTREKAVQTDKPSNEVAVQADPPQSAPLQPQPPKLSQAEQVGHARDNHWAEQAQHFPPSLPFHQTAAVVPAACLPDAQDVSARPPDATAVRQLAAPFPVRSTVPTSPWNLRVVDMLCGDTEYLDGLRTSETQTNFKTELDKILKNLDDNTRR